MKIVAKQNFSSIHFVQMKQLHFGNKNKNRYGRGKESRLLTDKPDAKVC